MSHSDLHYQPSVEDLRQLREWIKKTPYVIQDYDDEFLEAIVRKCKGSLQKTKTVLENLNSLGMRYPDYFNHMDLFDKKTQEHINNVNCFILPERTEDESLICIMSLNEGSDAYKFHLHEGQRHTLMCFYTLVWEKMFGPGKFIIIFDYKHLTPLHLREATPVFLKNLAEMFAETYPFRVTAIHCVNVPPVLEWVVNLFKTFVKKNKMLNRIHVHRSVETLYSSVPAKLLPKDYGGEQKSTATLNSEWNKKLECY